MHKIISCALFLCFFVIPVNATNIHRDRIGSNQKDPRNERSKQTMLYNNKRLVARKRKESDKESYLIRKQERCKKENHHFDR